MLLFLKQIEETQMSKPLEATRHHNSTKLSFYPSEPFSFVHFNMIHPVKRGHRQWENFAVFNLCLNGLLYSMHLNIFSEMQSIF